MSLTSRAFMALICLPCTATANEVVFSDNDFSGWSTSTFLDGIGGSVSASSNAGGGNPGGFLSVSNFIPGGPTAVWGFHKGQDAVYSPTLQGAIGTIDFSVDYRAIDAIFNGHGFHLGIRQDGNLYLPNNPATGNTSAIWRTFSENGLTESAFGQLKANGRDSITDFSSSPDFSENGSVIELGLITGSSMPGGGPTHTRVAGYDNWSVEIQPPPAATVLLSFDDPAPFRYVGHSIGGNSIVFPLPLETPPAVVSDAKKAEVLQATQRVFDDSGIDILVTADKSTNPDVVVYLAGESPTATLNGISRNGVDRFNTNSGEPVIVYNVNTINPQFIASTIAHEAGHAFGLRHVEGDDEVMDSTPQALEIFNNSIRDITDVFSVSSHNPRYHLERWVENRSRSVLEAEGIRPGTWDEEMGELLNIPVQLEVTANNSIQELFDLMVFSGFGGQGDVLEELHQILAVDQISISELSSVILELEPESPFLLVASSMFGGPIDVSLSLGDSFELANILLPPHESRGELLLLRQTGDTTFESIAEVTVIIVPEPSALTGAVAFIVILSLCGFGPHKLSRF